MPSPDKKSAEAPEKSWLNYALMHKPEAGKEYTTEQKKEMLSKMMAGYFLNAQKIAGDEKPFSVSEARRTAASIADTYSFQALTADENELNEKLNASPETLITTTAQIANPFGTLTFEEKKLILKRLQTEVLPEMAVKGGRSEKYKNMVDSINFVDPDSLTDQAATAALNNILTNTEKYLKGKKSLRSDAEEQARFNHGVDIMAVLGSYGGGAKLHYQGMVHRINQVRKNRHQQTIEATDYGQLNSAARHGKAIKSKIGSWEIITNDEKAPVEAQAVRPQQNAAPVREQPNVNPVQPQQGANPARPQQNAAPVQPQKKVLTEAEKIAQEKDNYKSNGINYLQKQFFEHEPETLKKIPAYPEKWGAFEKNPMKLGKVSFWNGFKDSIVLPMEQKGKVVGASPAGKMMFASIMTLATIPMFRGPDGDLGVDKDMFQKQYDKYMKDPAIDKMAVELKDPEDRQDLCNGSANPTYDKIDPGKLTEKYYECQKELKNEAPVVPGLRI